MMWHELWHDEGMPEVIETAQLHMIPYMGDLSPPPDHKGISDFSTKISDTPRTPQATFRNPSRTHQNASGALYLPSGYITP